MMKRLRNRKKEDAELDITSFMNLMIVLVPVLLLSLVFSQIRILNLQLPQTNSESQAQNEESKVLELIVNEQGFVINYPSGVLLTKLDKQDGAYPYKALSTYLQDLKLTFQQQKLEKNEILLLLQDDTDYQTIISTMDTVRSFKAVVAANLVDAELFPVISLGDAPQ